MAIVEPSLAGVDRSRRFLNDEIHTVEVLAKALPDSCTIFHSMEWVNLKDTKAHFGEIDLCIVSPSGITVTIEQKNGGLKTSAVGDLYKEYSTGKRSFPSEQLTRTRNALKALWKRARKRHDLKIVPLIYLPDHILNAAATAVDETLVIDATRKDQLSKKVSHLLKLNSCQPDKEQKARVLQFFRSQFTIMPSVAALFSRKEQFYTKKQSELTEFINALSFDPAHLLIEGGAGSGKTQIAVELFQKALNDEKKPLLLCYNRPLAKDLEVVAKNTIGVITNVDRFVDEYMKTRAIYDLAEESSGDVFGKLKYLAQTETVEKDWQFDVLIIDEAQDFTEENFQFALHFLTPNSDIIVLKDNQQNVYSNGFDFKPTVSLRLDKNYRNAYEVIAFTDALLGKNYRKNADALTFDLTPTIEAYEGEQGYIAKLIQRVKEYLSLNFNIDDMVVIVGCGQKNSWLMKQHQIGPWKIKRFTGGYSEDGDQLYTEGELLVDTVYRFKGRQKPIVLFTEIDFIKWSDRIERLLYVGCTRAEISCSLFITEQAEQAILARSRQEQVQSVDA